MVFCFMIFNNYVVWIMPSLYYNGKVRLENGVLMILGLDIYVCMFGIILQYNYVNTVVLNFRLVCTTLTVLNSHFR